MRRAFLLLAAATISSGSTFACHRGMGSESTVQADSVNGIVRVVGNMPFPQVLIVRAGGASVAVAAGVQRDLLQGLSAVGVIAFGEPGTGMSEAGAPLFNVSRFEVRSVGGVPAHDGTLDISSGNTWLRLANGDRQQRFLDVDGSG